MTNCQECGKPLKSIGTARKNGKTTHGDWATREYHKKCWKELENKKNSYNYINQLLKENASLGINQPRVPTLFYS